MSFLDKMERKFGRHAIPNLTLIIIITYAAGYLIELFASNMLGYLLLEPALILQGQVWRLVSWILIPPGSFNMWVFLTLFCYYSIGVVVERALGDFRYNIYIFGGVLSQIIGAFLLWAIGGRGLIYYNYGYYFSTYYISMSLFAAFAALYPNMQVLFMMFIPLKAKWIAILYVVEIVIAFAQGGWGERVAVLCSAANFVLFFFVMRRRTRPGAGSARQRQFKRAVSQGQAAAGITKHKCAICGRTERDGEDLEFRFCSRCNGNYEYCQDHLFTHTHVQ